MVLCGWGLGKFREGSKAAVDESTELLFDASPDMPAIVDSSYGTCASFLDYASKNKPDSCKVCYHKTSKEPEGTWNLQKDR